MLVLQTRHMLPSATKSSSLSTFPHRSLIEVLLLAAGFYLFENITYRWLDLPLFLHDHLRSSAIPEAAAAENLHCLALEAIQHTKVSQHWDVDLERIGD